MKYIVVKRQETPIEFTVNLVLNGGTCGQDTIRCSTDKPYDLPVVTREGCFFGGWFSDAGFTYRIDESSAVMPSVTVLYAKWVEIGNNYTEFAVYIDHIDWSSLDIYRITKKSSSSAVYIDWGDGSQSILTAADNYNISHDYEEDGDYRVRISDDASLLWINTSSSYYPSIRGIIKWSTSLTRIPDYCFCNCDLSYDDYEVKADFSHVTSLGSYAFYGCGIENVDEILKQMKSVTVIPDYCFCHCECSELDEDCFKNKTSIGNYAFYNNQLLTSVVIPSSVTSIGNQAFGNCYYLGSITVNRDSPPTIYQDTFYYAGDSVDSEYRCLYVRYPNNYRTSYWLSVLLNKSGRNFHLYSTNQYSAQGFRIEGIKRYYSYTGNNITPEPSVYNREGEELVKNVDYTVSYSNNKNIGTATVTITGIGSYIESRTINFTIWDSSQAGISIDLNGQWRALTTWTNSNTNYDVYESNSNYHSSSSSYAKMYIRVTGAVNLIVYTNSYGRHYTDWTVISKLNNDFTSYSYTYYYSSSSMGYSYTTYGSYGYNNPSSGTIGKTSSDSYWCRIPYTIGSMTNYIAVVYHRGSSGYSNYDRGYIAIPNNINKSAIIQNTNSLDQETN